MSDFTDLLGPVGDAYTNLTDIVTQPLGISESEQAKALKRAGRSLEQIQAPTLTPLELGSVGDYRDFMAPQGQSALTNASPEAKAAQLAALQRLQQESQLGTALTPEEQANLANVRAREATVQQGERGAIMQNAAQRGLGSSGLTLDSLLRSNQASAANRSLEDVNIAAQARQRAMDALLNSSTLAGNIRGQDYQAAGAQDVINRFNAGLMSDAGQQELAKRQQIENLNRAARNDLPLQQYQLDFGRRQDINAPNIAAGNARTNQLTGAFDRIANFATGVATGGASGMVKPGYTPTMPTDTLENIAPTYQGMGRKFNIGGY